MLETTYRTPFVCWSVIFILLPTDFLALQVIKFYSNQSVHWRIQLALFLSLMGMGWKREETIIIASGSQNGFKLSVLIHSSCLLSIVAWGKHSNLHELKYHARPLILYMIFLSTNQAVLDTVRSASCGKILKRLICIWPSLCSHLSLLHKNTGRNSVIWALQVFYRY